MKHYINVHERPWVFMKHTTSVRGRPWDAVVGVHERWMLMGVHERPRKKHTPSKNKQRVMYAYETTHILYDLFMTVHEQPARTGVSHSEMSNTYVCVLIAHDRLWYRSSKQSNSRTP